MRVLVVLLLFWQSNLYSQLVINEIMAAPQDGGPEWIEIYSNSDSDVELIDWTISDKVKTSAIPNLIIEPNTFIVLTKNKTDFLNLWDVNSDLVYELDLPILNNTTDDVVIKDASGAIVDSVYYSTKWGETGKSLERIAVSDPSNESTNWAAPLQDLLGTPGELNTHSVAKIIQNINLGDLLINEIMFDTDDNCGEFLELYNSFRTQEFS